MQRPFAEVVSNTVRRRQDHAARQFRGRYLPSGSMLCVDQPVAWSAGLAIHLYAADTCPLTAGKNFQFIFFVNRAGNQRSRDDRAEPLHGEHAVDRQRARAVESLAGISAATLDQYHLELMETRSG